VGLLTALLLGAAIGGLTRASMPRHAPQRLDVATMLAAVGGALAVLAGTVLGKQWSGRVSTGGLFAAVVGSSAILAAFALLPRAAPTLVRSLPGREPPGES
jgi:uncharacterized membrane protein YeaQ/YmgE (transglycosylase-associated protein family)